MAVTFEGIPLSIGVVLTTMVVEVVAVVDMGLLVGIVEDMVLG